MISGEAVRNIMAVYEKHGWRILRALVSRRLRERLGPDLETLFAGCNLLEAEFDAIWFERPSKPGLTAIELRHLDENPFALFELINTGSADLSAKRQKEMERQMAEYISKLSERQGH